MKKKLYKISGLDCESCAKNLELDFEDEGIKASCNLDSQTLEVDFDQQSLNEGKIKEIVEKAGLQII